MEIQINNLSIKYENKIMEILKAAKLSFYREKTFQDLKKGLFRFDFYLYNYCGRPVIVEVDGEQHFKPVYGRQAFLKGYNKAYFQQFGRLKGCKA